MPVDLQKRCVALGLPLGFMYSSGVVAFFLDKVGEPFLDGGRQPRPLPAGQAACSAHGCDARRE